MRARKELLNEYHRKILEFIKEDKVDDLSSKCSNIMPQAETTRVTLHRLLNICGYEGKRPFKVYIVEKFDDYKVLVQIPDSKQAKGLTKKELKEIGLSRDKVVCDFNVWIWKVESNEVIFPTHDYMFARYLEIKRIIPKRYSNLPYKLLEKMVRERLNYDIILSRIPRSVKSVAYKRMLEFYSTIKWIILQEDVNYRPPRYLGSLYTLAAYALLEMGFSSKDIRRIIRFR